MPTVASPLAAYSEAKRPRADATCLTYGQWLERNTTSSAGESERSLGATSPPPSARGSEKSGAGVPIGTMNELTAIPPILTQSTSSPNRAVDHEPGPDIWCRSRTHVHDRRGRAV